MNPKSRHISDAGPDRAARNRANARHSTGPKTETGKHRSSLNALRHGLTGHVIVLPTEDLEAYQRFTKRFFDDFKPQGALEEQLVQMLADTSWRLNRIPALETNLLALGLHDNADRVDTADPEVHTALVAAATIVDQTRALNTISMHEQRLSRQLERTLKQLREIQAERRQREREQMEKAADLLQMHQEQELPYDPAEDGFVFSNAEIETHIRRKERRDEASSAASRRYWGE